MFSYSYHRDCCWYHERRSFRDGMAALLVLAVVVFGLLHAPDLAGRHHHVHHRPAHTAPAHHARHHSRRTPSRLR